MVKKVYSPSFDPITRICKKKDKQIINSATERKKERAKGRWRETVARKETEPSMLRVLY